MKKTNMKKMVSLVMSAMMFTGIFAGCGQSGSGNSSDDSSSSGKPSISSLSLSAANVNLEKAANTSVALTAAGLGITVSDGATLS